VLRCSGWRSCHPCPSVAGGAARVPENGQGSREFGQSDAGGGVLMASPAKTTTSVQETGPDRKAEPMGYPATRGAAGIPASDPAERLQALAGNQAVATF